MSDKIKVYYHGDSPTAHTGFGRVAREVLLRLHNTGKYQLFIHGINYYGDPHDLEGVLKVWPVSPHDMQGRQRFPSFLKSFNPDVLFTINDYDALNWMPNDVLRVSNELNKDIKWCWYFPVDGEPFRQRYIDMMNRTVKYPVTYTKWAQDVVKKTDSSFDIPYVYHGVDRNLFSPLSKEAKLEARRKLNIDEDAFVVLSMGVNQLRKQFNMVIEAFKHFRKGKEDKAILYLHTQQVTNYGWDLPSIIIDEGLQDCVYFTHGLMGPTGIPHHQMNYIYNIADVAIFPHVGEGFGLHQIEAMAAGLPVISHGVSATPEVLKDAGILVPTEQITDPSNPDNNVDLTMKFAFGDRGLNRPIVSISKLVESMNDVYNDRKILKSMSKKGLNVVRNSPEFDWDNIAQFFDDLLTKAAKDNNTIDIDIDEII